jgi:2-polyprenyl-3-methyl-5-hydroxy-6-metoxy-1,4-benzoquinol methylase
MENKTNGKSETAESPASMAGIGTHELVLEEIPKHLPKPCRIVDLAAGEGAFSIKLKELGHDVLAIDASRENWKVPEIELQIQNLDSEFAEKISSGDNKFDAVVAIEIIEHLENPFRFARECAKLLKPGGLLFLTTPNVEAVYSRLIFLYTGRLHSFGAYETVRPAHITPIFKWKLDILLEEANFEIVEESFNQVVFAPGTNLKVKLSLIISKFLSPFVKGAKGAESRIIIARLR